MKVTIKWLVLITLCLYSLVAKTQAPDMSMESPYHTIYAFLYHLQPETYSPDKAAAALAFEGSRSQKRELAVQLKAVLDGGGYYVVVGKLPRDPDYVDTISGRHVYFPFHERRPEIYVEKYGQKWLFSYETIDAIPNLYQQTFPFGIAKLINKLPESMQQAFLGVPIWKWAAIPSLLILVASFFYLFLLISHYTIKFIGNNYIRHLRGQDKLKKRIASLFSWYFALGMALLFLPSLMLPVKAMNFLIPIVHIIRTVIIIAVVLRIADVAFLYAKDYVERTPSKMDDQLLPIFIKLVQFIIVIGGVFNVLQQLDVNVTALIAGVSIGGLALALAAQDTVKNLIGSSMIFLDKPFQIGDYIIGGSYEGTVEEVGFRTTRLRNADKSVISIPNGNVAGDTIVNLGLRPARRLQLTIGLMYNTDPDKIQQFLDGLKVLIDTHPHTSKTDYIIRFHNLGASSLDIFFRVYIFASTIAAELESREDIIFGIVRLAQRVHVSFAFPSTSIYMEQTKEPEPDQRNEEDIRNQVAAFLEQYERRLERKYNAEED